MSVSEKNLNRLGIFGKVTTKNAIVSCTFSVLAVCWPGAQSARDSHVLAFVRNPTAALTACL